MFTGLKQARNYMEAIPPNEISGMIFQTRAENFLFVKHIWKRLQNTL